MDNNPELRLVFLDIGLFDQGTAIRGAILITDIETKPYEFRCTSAVKPTPLQRILYGDTLEDYVQIDLIAVPLLNAAKETPTLVLVRNPPLLKVRPRVNYPVVLARPDQSTVSKSEADQGGVKVVTITGHREFAAETSSAQAVLAIAMQRRDLMEPFERLMVALGEAHKQHIGDTSSSGKRS